MALKSIFFSLFLLLSVTIATSLENLEATPEIPIITSRDEFSLLARANPDTTLEDAENSLELRDMSGAVRAIITGDAYAHLRASEKRAQAYWAKRGLENDDENMLSERDEAVENVENAESALWCSHRRCVSSAFCKRTRNCHFCKNRICI
ncbi:hypothetical protein AJ79_09919 [Helicocarpus griseus UAMH5409]|uniref:Uncharacterized protein n=1 Tax=Helicocarpus griseus UAMH5409 TaxID=1447875 RepID=A0A2B7WGE2_9EURO|nr:hypothetical protein AJ79_09919 [Helicocarpus griseus UAMH5409]